MGRLLDNLKMQRVFLRETISNMLMEIEDTLIQGPEALTTLEEYLGELRRQEESLAELDRDIAKAVDDQELEKELEGAREFREKVTAYIRKLERRLKELMREKQKSSGNNSEPGKSHEVDPKGGGSSSVLRKIAIGAGITVGAGAAVALAPVAIAAVGFTSAGVAAGSLAASFQSAFLGGTIVKGSLFALLQSAGATGNLSTSTLVGVGAAGATTGGVVTYAASKAASSGDKMKKK